MKPHEILNQFLNRKKEVNPSYSLRAFARDLDLSPSFVSNILNGKKKIPTGKLDKIVKILDLDRSSESALRQSLALHKIQNIVPNNFEFNNRFKEHQNFKPLSKKKYSLLAKWYYVAVLDLITCNDFIPETPWMAKRLGLLTSQVDEALMVLQKLELIEVSDSGIKKKNLKIRFPTTHTQVEVRNFHKQMIEQALLQLANKTSQTDFERRLISGITFAASPEKIESAKQQLADFIHKISAELMDGDCKEVYQLNLQLFPLSKSR